MGYSLRRMTTEDIGPFLAIFNHYIETSLAAFPDKPVGAAFAKEFLDVGNNHPVIVAVSGEGDVVGFGFVRPYFPMSTMARTGLVGYFIAPEHCGKGLGTRMLDELIGQARAAGVDNLLAMVSARNEGSLRFHLRNGFEEVGRFRAVARKFGEDLDQVWFQRRI